MQITSTELKDTFRIEVDDLPKDDGDTSSCLWSDADIYRYMNSAASQVARRVMSLVQTFTLDIEADEPMIELPTDRILKVYRAFTATRRELQQLNLNDDGFTVCDYGITLNVSNWETATGSPQAFCLDYQPGQLRLAPIPTAADTLYLTAAVLPEVFEEGDDLPFTDTDDQELMLLWMKKMAYGKHDADTFDSARTVTYEQEFRERVRQREPEFRRQTRAPGVVRSAW